ncbi:MAG: cell envelope integrity protein TolA [Bdellovibrionota bacterium]
MKADKFLITTSVNGRSRKVLWDSSEPISIDQPKSWSLQNREGAIWVTSGAGRESPLDSELIEKGDVFELHPDAPTDRLVELQIRRLEPIRAAYLPSAVSLFKRFEAKKSQQPYAACGVRKFLVNYTPIHGVFVVYVRKKPVFTYRKSDRGGILKSLLPDVKLKLKGQVAEPMVKGEQVELSEEDLSSAMIMRGAHWWRILPVATPESLSENDMALKAFDPQEADFKRMLKFAGALFAFLCLILIFVPTHKEEVMKPVTEIPKVSLKKPKTNQSLKSNVEDKKKGGAASAMNDPNKASSLAEAKGPNPSADKEPAPPEPKKQRAAKSEQKADTKPPGPKELPKPDPVALERAANEKALKEKERQAKEKELTAKRAEDAKIKTEKLAIEAKSRAEKSEADAKIREEKAAAAKVTAERLAKERVEKAAAEAQARAEKEAAAKVAAEKAAKEKAEREAAARVAAEKAAKEKAARAASDKAKMLKESLGGLMGGGGRVPSTQGADSGTGAADVLEGNGTGLAPSVPKPGGYNKFSKVETIGGPGGKGDGGGVSYGTGEHGKLRGQGAGAVDIDGGANNVSQGLTRDEVGTVIHSHLAEIRYCYDAATVRRPGLEGKVVLAFTIDGKGKVKLPSVESSTVEDRMLERCMIGKLVSWKFPNPRGGVDVAVSYPFVFKMVGND